MDHGRAGGELDPSTATTFGQYTDLLRRLHVRAGRPTMRALEQWARTQHEAGRPDIQLTRTTVSDVLTGKRPPTKDFVRAFTEACGVNDDGRRVWLRAWEAVADHHHFATSPTGAADDGPPPTALAGDGPPPTALAGGDLAEPHSNARRRTTAATVVPAPVSRRISAGWRGFAAGLLTGVIVSSAGFIFLNGDSNGPDARPAAVSSPTPTAVAGPQRVALQLSPVTPIPQRGWYANTQEAAEDAGDFAIECRSRRNRLTRCVSGQPVAYHLLPDHNRGIKAVAVTEDPTTDRRICANARMSGVWLQMQQGGFYCIDTTAHLVGIRADQLPLASDSVTVTLTITVWNN